MNKAVFFDKDGVINDLIERLDGRFTSPWTIEEFKFSLKQNIEEAVNLVKEQGFLCFVVTNQPGVVDREMTPASLFEIEDYLFHILKFDDIRSALFRGSCFYKPNNQTFIDLIKYHDIDIKKSYIIGDRWKDIVAGYNSGLTTFFVGEDYTTPYEHFNIQPDYIVSDALAACQIIKEIDNGL